MGRWDQKRPAIGFDLDKAGIILIAIGAGMVIIAVGSTIIGTNMIGFSIKGAHLIPGIVAQIFFIASGIVVASMGIVLFFINGGHIKIKALEYRDDKFGKDWD